MIMRPLAFGATTNLAVTSSSARAAIAGNGNTILICNKGTDTAFIKIGDSAVAAATTDWPVLGGSYLTFSRNPDTATHIAAICAGSDTTDISAMAGEGL
jgi:hypothetical protein